MPDADEFFSDPDWGGASDALHYFSYGQNDDESYEEQLENFLALSEGEVTGWAKNSEGEKIAIVKISKDVIEKLAKQTLKSISMMMSGMTVKEFIDIGEYKIRQTLAGDYDYLCGLNEGAYVAPYKQWFFTNQGLNDTEYYFHGVIWGHW